VVTEGVRPLLEYLCCRTRLLIEKPIVQSEFDIMNELKNVCVKIPLLQAIRDVPIYAKTIKEIYIKKPGWKMKDPPTIHLVG
jgi:hypothetical protein